jgi:hypothetical protein
MQKSKIQRVALNDYNRVLLTETLPYEIPILITNEGFYIRQKGKNRSTLIDAILSSNKETKPFVYKIKKTKDSNRSLYLIHPANQIDFVGFYRNYQDLIVGLTSRSHVSLRSPHEVCSSYYDPSQKTQDNSLKDEGPESHSTEKLSQQFKYSSSFFSYKKYDFLYKFYDSYEFHRIEKKFKKLIKFDIAKCFDHIATRRLGESIKDESYQRENKRKHNFESVFSTLMKNSNFGRESGIVIGPEISRIFAEIVLQRIDRDVLKKLEKKSDFFEVRRYVDDYFLFTNDLELGKTVLSEYETALSEIKLYFNESKISFNDAPFLTGVTMAKKDIQDIFSRLFQDFNDSRLSIDKPSDESVEDDESPDENIRFFKYSHGPGIAANRFIRDIKAIVRNNEISFESITGYFFTVIRKKAYEILKICEQSTLMPREHDELFKFLQVLIDISFFVYSMDARVRSTFLISQIAIICCRIAKTLPLDYREEITRKNQDEILFALNCRTYDDRASGVESVNLLITLREISDEADLLDKEKLLRLINGNEESPIDKLNYFQVISLIFYIRNNSEFKEFKELIAASILRKIKDNRVSTCSETAHLFLDLMSCPYIETSIKESMTKEVLRSEVSTTFSAQDLKHEMNMLSRLDWFVDWSESGLKIERLLSKKELKPSYG